MSKLVWTKENLNGRYEQGVDKCVLYVDGVGVVWNGITGLDETTSGGERNERFLDGLKYMEDLGSMVYQASVKAYQSPPEFDACVGYKSVVRGFTLANQPRKKFHFSYRTLVGELGYKIHLVYNATATLSAGDFVTQGGSTTAPTIFEWKIDAVPPPSKTYKPTPHLVIDSTKTSPSSLALVEALLYGTTSADPYMPDPSVIIGLLQT